jgi:hypothetical protein
LISVAFAVGGETPDDDDSSAKTRQAIAAVGLLIFGSLSFAAVNTAGDVRIPFP